jgi:hypothetical protein
MKAGGQCPPTPVKVSFDLSRVHSRPTDLRKAPRLCLWAAMHRLRYRASPLTQAVRSDQDKEFCTIPRLI